MKRFWIATVLGNQGALIHDFDSDPINPVVFIEFMTVEMVLSDTEARLAT